MTPGWKYHGAKNDFLFVEADPSAFFGSLEALRGWAKATCHRTAGLGADGILFLSHSPNKGLRALIVNSDGSLAGTCGNALRCVGLHARRRGWWDGKTTLAVGRYVTEIVLAAARAGPDTGSAAGLANDEHVHLRSAVFATLLEATLLPTGSDPAHAFEADVAVGMGPVVTVRACSLPVSAKAALAAAGVENPHGVKAVFAELSNPHLVLFSPLPGAFSALSNVSLSALGTAAQGDWRVGPELAGVPLANIGFLSPSPAPGATPGAPYSLVVFERGAGLTQCCGSGAVAARAALESLGVVKVTDPSVGFSLPGGCVSIGAGPNRVLKGPAACVAELRPLGRLSLAGARG